MKKSYIPTKRRKLGEILVRQGRITPDELMEHFRGPGLKTIIVFTVLAHAVLLIGTSVPAIKKLVGGKESAALSEEERIEQAVREATASLKEIAEEHGLKPQDLSSQFAGGASNPARRAIAKTPADGAKTPTAEAEKPKSPIEEKIEKVEVGPTVPGTEDEEEDLFK